MASLRFPSVKGYHKRHLPLRVAEPGRSKCSVILDAQSSVFSVCAPVCLWKPRMEPWPSCQDLENLSGQTTASSSPRSLFRACAVLWPGWKSRKRAGEASATPWADPRGHGGRKRRGGGSSSGTPAARARACVLPGLRPPSPLVTWEAQRSSQTRVPSPQSCRHRLTLSQGRLWPAREPVFQLLPRRVLEASFLGWQPIPPGP